MNARTNDHVLSFKCSETGGKFEVTFRRRIPTDRFRILRISDPLAAATFKIFSGGRSQLPQGSKAVLRVDKSAQLDTGNSVKSIEEMDASDFDFSGWFCGCCRFGHPSDSRKVHFQFVACGTCKQYVCGATGRIIGGGAIVFECSGGCRGGGVVGDGLVSLRGAEAPPNTDARQLQSSGSKHRLRLKS